MFILSRLQLALLLSAYFYLGVMKIPQHVVGSFNDLIMHGLGYGILMLSGLFAFPNKHYILRLILAFFAYSFFIECVQFFLPHRSFSWLDMLANGAGLIMGSLIGYLTLPLMKNLRVDLNSTNTG